jgi:hypothetical protein
MDNETQYMFATDDAAACGCCRRFGQLESQAGKPHSGEADTVIKDLLAHWQVLSRTRRAV